ncbi:pre-mRNA-splicing factor CWC22 [Rhizoctonia solani]|uniref:Pre-mRNA-splicing factor CWC22 n=1 Tax=Rhizoctonia solani TaxID=456999 RepID=A0A8H8P959_9AGAM|nr:pre-mRNA-splicing factor CWC22 [Rhizoctonia solani]QRW26910.1 pre-mRNA-splicing factor CWC22 [Rhizoctonia solani]
MPILDSSALAERFHEEATRALVRRVDVKTSLTPNDTQRTTLIIAGVYVIAIGLLWHIPFLSWIIYPFKLLTVGFHEMSHAFAGVLTCAKIHSIELDPDEGGATRMSGGISMITLPAGYIGSCFIGACLIACGFDTNASKVACIVLAVFFLVTLWWARKNWLTWALIAGMTGLIVLFWFVAGGVALRYFVLFMGVMNCIDAAVFAKQFGCCPAQVWGVIWLLIAFVFFALGVLVGIAAFKDTAAEQAAASKTFLPVPTI